VSDDVVHILETNIKKLSDNDVKEIAALTAHKINVVIRDQELDKKEYARILRLWGKNPKRNIWFEDTNDHEIMYVTNKYMVGEENRQGIFARGELEWHCNGAMALDPEDCVSLYCHQPTEDPCNTYFINGVVAYQSLPKDVKDKIKDTFLILSYYEKNFQKLRMDYLVRTKIQPRLLSDLSVYKIEKDQVTPDEHRDLLAMTARARSEDSLVGKEMLKIKEKYSDSSGLWNCVYKKLVHSHRLTGIDGLFFPFTNVVGFHNIPKDEWLDLYKFLEEHYTKHAYCHVWEEGDVIVFDQTQGLHRRDNIPLDENGAPQDRELWRGAFWYDGMR